ncbi:autotransporter outer membrane beta-barrel domain-containing protein [Sphingomonas sp. QA11]|uniref:autotransporter outer membrane beta-barrel domain-containing protein n=1 Tax=Sphingomonas sp. QA11 TaxID=2950605 RepID=UPI0023495CC9|nr:autotransporter outer membrane beta-barrel domain-containing protein [Sphingomonas sp. QA11]WCM25884.1 autotransporter outer membrane beta-barrel domain-containing protein [Sphingomonas sp. QA11]
MKNRKISRTAMLRGATALMGSLAASLFLASPAEAATGQTCIINGYRVAFNTGNTPIFDDSSVYATGSPTVCDYAVANPSSLTLVTDSHGTYYHSTVPVDLYSDPVNSTRYYLANTQTLVINPATQATTTVNTYATTIQGKLLGGSLLYNQSFDQPYASATVQAGVAAARLAITTAGGPGVVLSAPTLVSHTVATSSATTSVYTFNHVATADHITTVEYVGGPGSLPLISLTTGLSLVGDPAYNGVQTVGVNGVNSTTPVLVGQLSDCSAAAATQNSTTKPVCTTLAGHQVRFGWGAVAYVATTNDTYYVDKADTVTTTTLTSETYLLQGIVKPIGVIHAIAAQAAFDTSEGFWQRSLDRFGADGGDRWRPWIAYWGQSRGTAGRGGAVGDWRSGTGVEGGLAVRITPGLIVGGGISAGTGHLALDDASESARLRQVDGGIFARIGRARGLALRLGAGMGGGHVSSIVTIPMVTDNAAARESVQTRWALAEASDRIAVAGGRMVITPLIGIGYTRVRLDGFTESGSDYALTAGAATQHRLREWAGGEVEIPVVPALTLTASVKAIHYDGDIAPSRAVAFVNYPGNAALNVTAAPMARWGAAGALGFEARLAPAISLFGTGQILAQDGRTDKGVTLGLRGRF